MLKVYLKILRDGTIFECLLGCKSQCLFIRPFKPPLAQIIISGVPCLPDGQNSDFYSAGYKTVKLLEFMLHLLVQSLSLLVALSLLVCLGSSFCLLMVPSLSYYPVIFFQIMIFRLTRS